MIIFYTSPCDPSLVQSPTLSSEAQPSFVLLSIANIEVSSALARAVSEDVPQLGCTNP